MEQLRDSQAIDLAANKFTTGSTPILNGLLWLRSKGKGGLISAYIKRVTAPDKFDIRRDNSKYQILIAVHEYSKKLGRGGDYVEPADILKSWNLSALYPLYVSLYGEQNPAKKGLIGDFLAKAKTWAIGVKRLADTPAATPQLEQEKQKILGRAKMLKNSIEAVFPDVKLDTGTLQAAPIVWFISGGVIASFLALMAIISKAVDAWQKKNTEAHQRFTQDPTQAIKYEQQLVKTEAGETIKAGTGLLLIGGLIYLLYLYGGKRRGN